MELYLHRLKNIPLVCDLLLQIAVPLSVGVSALLPN